MTTIQIAVLITLILGATLLYWVGYRGGLIDGRFKGIDEGKDLEYARNTKTIGELEASLRFICGDHRRLAQPCKKLKASQTFSAEDRQNLLYIAEKLKLAADTFHAMSSKNQAQQALDLRDKALNMAALLEPAAQKEAA